MSSKIRFAMVEDDHRYRQRVVTSLEQFEDLRCCGAWPDAETALLGLNGDSPDVLLVDLLLPGLTGVKLIRQIHEEKPEMLLVALTAVEDSEVVFRALENGAVGYLLKTAQPGELREAILEARSGGSPMTGSIARKVIEYFRQKEKRRHLLELLTARESQVIQLLAEGRIYKEIAGQLKVSPETIRAHIRNIYKKLHVNSRRQALQKTGLLERWLRPG
jgi:DNA-binding NarL/FixJ family response regulator